MMQALITDNFTFSWAYADLNRMAYKNPLRWSMKKSFELTVAEVQTKNPYFTRPINVIEYVLDTEKKRYKACSFEELFQESEVMHLPTK